MNVTLKVASFLLLFLAACSGGSGGMSNQSINEPGSVLVVVDTRAGDDTMVQFLVAGATLEDSAGGQTGNLLAETKLLTVDDPSGEQSGLRLRSVPSGDYQALHLILVPGSGMALGANGDMRPVDGPLDVRIEIAGGLLHNRLMASWLVVGHDAVPLLEQGGSLAWTPTMSGRFDEEALVIGELSQPVGNAAGVMTTARTVGDGMLQVSGTAGCIYEREDGSAYPDLASFLSELGSDDELRADGRLRRDGHIDAHRVRRGRRNDQPRLIGRILSLDPTSERFKFEVQATTRRGTREFLAVPEEVIVSVANARIQASNGGALRFADLAVGQLAKIKWLIRTPVPGGLPRITAREVEIPGGNSGQMHPQLQGRVQSVDVANSTLTVVPRNNTSIVIQGTAVAQLSVRISPGTYVERKQKQGGGRTQIGLADIQPGVDRIWLRGTVTGPTTIEASQVRVRED